MVGHQDFRSPKLLTETKACQMRGDIRDPGKSMFSFHYTIVHISHMRRSTSRLPLGLEQRSQGTSQEGGRVKHVVAQQKR